MSISPSSHCSIEGRSVFMTHDPVDSSTLEENVPVHRIGVLSSGDFEVTCRHSSLCSNVIIAQVRSVIAKREAEKKNN